MHSPKVDFLRHSGWVEPSILNMPVCIIGVGALGSHVALMAAKMGFTKFIIWDHDKVEEHNLPNQAFDLNHVGLSKVEAMKDVLLRFNPEISIQAYDRLFYKEDGFLLSGLVVSAVDSIAARRLILETTLAAGLSALFEARLGFDFAVANIVNLDNPGEAQNFISGLQKSDDEIPEGPCSLRICTTLVCIVAAYLVHQMCHYAAVLRKGTEWTHAPSTMFQLSPDITTINIK